MQTKVLLNNSNDLETAADLLKQGKLVAIPTETVYGLAADALNDKAVYEIFKVKGRQANKGLIVLINNIDNITKLTLDFNISAKKLAKAFWPGPLTMVLKKSLHISNLVSGGLNTIAIRFSNGNVASEIMKKGNLMLVCPSANISGDSTTKTFDEAFAALNNKIDAIIKFDQDCIGIESTIISLAGDKPQILREGAIKRQSIEAVIGSVI